MLGSAYKEDLHCRLARDEAVRRHTFLDAHGGIGEAIF